MHRFRVAYMDVGERREHACMDAGSRATQGAVAEDAVSFAALDKGTTIACALRLDPMHACGPECDR